MLEGKIGRCLCFYVKIFNVRLFILPIFKLLGLRTCQYNISIMIKVKLELNRVEVEIGDHLGISFAHFLAICLAASKVDACSSSGIAFHIFAMIFVDRVG